MDDSPVVFFYGNFLEFTRDFLFLPSLDRGGCDQHLNSNELFPHVELWINVHAGINDGADIPPPLSENQ